MAKIWVTPNSYFHRGEFTVSGSYPEMAQHQIVTDEEWDIVKLGVESILDPFRIHIEQPVIITSGIRHPELNELVGGAPDSDHQYANAADIVTPRLSSKEIAGILILLGVPFRQIVAYDHKPHCHVSWNIPGRTYKREVVFK